MEFNCDPVPQFAAWFAEAEMHEPNDPNAMSLATVDVNGAPHVRIVLCKGFDAAGLRFFTNMESNKGHDLAAHPHAAVCFHWKSLSRQVRAEGTVQKLPAAEDDAYFHTRHRDSQIGAWASQQSRPLESGIKLTTEFHQIKNKFTDQAIPRPPYWGGYLIIPHRIEFWQQRPHRLHERMLYTRENGEWQQMRLYP